MTMITPSYLGETIEYSSLHACRSTLEDPTRPAVGNSRAGAGVGNLWLTGARQAVGATAPEPGTFAVLLAGLIGGLVLRRRKADNGDPLA